VERGGRKEEGGGVGKTEGEGYTTFRDKQEINYIHLREGRKKVEGGMRREGSRDGRGARKLRERIGEGKAREKKEEIFPLFQNFRRFKIHNFQSIFRAGPVD
jgi:hypothetical protein